MKSFFNNKFFQALLLLMLISAIIHMVVLGIYFIFTLDYSPFNFFRIIGLNLFYPEFVSSPYSASFSIFSIICIYFFSYLFLTNKQNR